MSEDRILRSESRTELQTPKFAEVDVECTPDCPRAVGSFRNGNLEQKSCSPIGIRALYNVDDERPGLRKGDRSRSPSRSPLRRIINPNSSFQDGRNPTTQTSTSDHGKRLARESDEQAVPHQSSTHYSPEVCDPNIASIIYSSPSHEQSTTPRKWKFPKVKFPWVWKRKVVKPECHLENKRTNFRSSEAKDQESSRKQKAWKKVREGKHGKSFIQRRIEWENSLRQYDSCSSWQRHVGHDTRKRYQDKLIKAAVQGKTISNIQELRTDALMMENELFGTAKDLDEYKAKARQILDVFRTRRLSLRNDEAIRTPAKHDWRESVVQAGGKLKELLAEKKSSFSQFWGSGQGSPHSSDESIPATACNCREKEIKLREERMRSGEEGSRFQNEDPWNRPTKKSSYKPNLKRIPPSYRDKRSAVGWTHRSREDPDEVANSNSVDNLHDDRFVGDEELDDDEWSIIDGDYSQKFANLFKCFGYANPI